MPDSPNTLTTLNGLAKEVYGDEVIQLVPDGTKVQKLVNFSSKEKQLGNVYHQPVLLAYEQGFTHAAASSGAFTLNDAKAGVMKDAQIQGAQILLKAQMDYETAARSAKGKNAFVDGTSLMIESMQKSLRKRLEVQLMYGGSGIGTLSAVSTTLLTISPATFASGIWAGAEGMEIDVMTGATGTVRGSATVVSVDLEAGTVTINAAVVGAAVSDVIYFKGAFGNEMLGIHAILANAGTIFGISAAAYSLWKAPSHAIGGQATRTKIGKGISKAVAKGLTDGVTILVNPEVFNELVDGETALVQHNSKDSKGKFENGADEITYYSQGGIAKIIPTIYCMRGFAYGLSVDSWKRVGAVDVSFNTPGSKGGEMFRQLETKAGFEVRAYSNQALFCEAIAKNVLFTGITVI